MILKEIIMNGQMKRIGPTIERFEALITTMRAMAISAQQVIVTTAIRLVAAASVRPAPHFTCNAETLVAIQ